MTKEKIKELFEKSKEIINMMEVLGIKEYRRYSIMDTAVGNFLKFLLLHILLILILKIT